MNEITGDFWALAPSYDAICVTTNGIVKNNGEAVMGAGIALAFKKRFPELPKRLAQRLKACGNTTQLFTMERDIKVISFPTKNDWKDKSDIELIKKSASEAVTIADKFNIKSILLPRPGCSNGGLNWADVKRVIEPILDDRFTIIARPGE